MSIQFDLPTDVESALREGTKDLNSAAKEAVLVELYRQQKLTHHQLARGLGISRLETDAVLKRHCVTEDLQTADEFLREVESLRRAAR